jgi:hypothetical protein
MNDTNEDDVFRQDIDDWVSRVAYVASHLRDINARFAANPQATMDPKQYGCIEYHLELIGNLQDELESELHRYTPDASCSEEDGEDDAACDSDAACGSDATCDSDAAYNDDDEMSEETADELSDEGAGDS